MRILRMERHTVDTGGKTMQVLIDADGCPVVDITLRLAKERNIPCIILCDTSHIFEREGVTTITVSKGADSVDFALVNRVQKGDIVVTQDYGLAAMCLAKGAVPISQDGMVYHDGNIEALLQQRYAAKKIRMAGGRLKGNAKRTKEQDIRFEEVLKRILLKNSGMAAGQAALPMDVPIDDTQVHGR